MGDVAAAPDTTIFLHEFATGGSLAGDDLPATWAAEGRAMRRALAADFARLPGVAVWMTLDARLPDEPGPWQVARIGPGEEAEVFDRLAATADFTLLVAPETGGILLDRARRIEQVGGRSLGSTPAAIERTADKLRLGDHLACRGIPVPEGRRVTHAVGLPADFPYPAVLKPNDGAGSVDTFLVESAAALKGGIGPGPMLLQPYLPGEPRSASFLVGPDGQLDPIGVALQRFALRDGRFHYLGGSAPVSDSRADRVLGEAVRSVTGLRGWVGVDFLWDEARGRATVLEINPRLTTSYVGWRRLHPRGELARRWLSAWQPGHFSPGGRANTAPARLPSAITFDADGTIDDEAER